jgi:hypothetical protein
VKVQASIYNFFLDLGFLHRGTIWLNCGTMGSNFFPEFCKFASNLRLGIEDVAFRRGTMASA